jgi:restriction system protein
MAVPDFQSLMLPVLKIAADGQEHSHAQVRDNLAIQFQLTDEERRELLPSGRQGRFDNRIAWARAHLKLAGLVESTGRGMFRITPSGLEVLLEKPTKIDIRFLTRFPEYVKSRSAARQNYKRAEPEDETGQTPKEILESSYQILRHELAQELLERVKTCSPRFFETLVVDLVVAMGYGGSRQDAEAVGRSGDGGIDGTIKEDRLGLDVVYIQAKKWKGTVGRPDVQAFAGSLDGQRARKGVMITTSQFSQEAKDYVGRIEKKIVLIDGEELAQLMIDHGIGVAEEATYTVKKLDLDYFEE